jgi:hypothetical protein
VDLGEVGESCDQQDNVCSLCLAECDCPLCYILLILYHLVGIQLSSGCRRRLYKVRR